MGKTIEIEEPRKWDVKIEDDEILFRWRQELIAIAEAKKDEELMFICRVAGDKRMVTATELSTF